MYLKDGNLATHILTWTIIHTEFSLQLTCRVSTTSLQVGFDYSERK